MNEYRHAQRASGEQPAAANLPTLGPNVPAILRAREAARAILAPMGKDLEALLMRLHEQSAQSQQKARESQEKARGEIYNRLEGKVVEVNDTDQMVVAVVTTRELIGLVEAESNLIKVEALSQRSYDFHRLASVNARPQAGSIESFIDQLEQEESTEGEPAP